MGLERQWWWVNVDRIFISEWTTPLNQLRLYKMNDWAYFFPLSYSLNTQRYSLCLFLLLKALCSLQWNVAPVFRLDSVESTFLAPVRALGHRCHFPLSQSSRQAPVVNEPHMTCQIVRVQPSKQCILGQQTGLILFPQTSVQL